MATKVLAELDSYRVQFLILAKLTFYHAPRLPPRNSIGVDIMNEVKGPEFAEWGASFAQVSSGTTRRLCEQGQSVIQTMNEWNAEISQFLAHRAARNGEALSRVAQCQNVPDLFGIQAQWVQDSTEDYLREIGRLTEFNSRIMGGWVGSIGTAVAPVPFESRTPPAKDRIESRKVAASGSAA